VVIKNVVDDAQAIEWKKNLQDFIEANPDVEGIYISSKRVSDSTC
jgi:hypothetical protein